MKALATLATYRYGCMGIDMTGSHGGIKICTQDYNETELKHVIQTYAFEMARRGSLGMYLCLLESWTGIIYNQIFLRLMLHTNAHFSFVSVY